MLLPTKSPYVSGETSVFDKLVRTGEEKSFIMLPVMLHVFLVSCLTEHLRDTEITFHILALGVLQSAEKGGEEGNELLKRTGDAALLLAGLFPERAHRLNVSSKYFRFLGQTAYANLAARLDATGSPWRGKFYDNVAEQFATLEKVLGATRSRSEPNEAAFKRFRKSLHM